MKFNPNIAKKVELSLERHAVLYTKPTDKAYKVMLIIFNIAAALTTLMTLFYIISELIFYSSITQYSAESLKHFMPLGIFYGAVVVLSAAGIVLMNLKKQVFSMALTVIPGAAAVIEFIRQMTGADMVAGLHGNFWIRHFFPFAVMTIAAIYLAYVRIKGDAIFSRAYKNMINRIYKEHPDTAGLSEEEWESFLNNYDPRAEEEKRRAAKKKKPAYNNQFDINK